MAKVYTIIRTNTATGRVLTDSMPLWEAVHFYGHILDCGISCQYDRIGNTKINRTPKTIASLIRNLNAAVNNSAANGCSTISYSAV